MSSPDFPAVINAALDNITDDVITNNAIFNLTQYNAKDIVRQIAVLQSETVELASAIRERDNEEYYDGLGDCLYVIGSIKQLEPVLWSHFHAVRESLFIIRTALRGLDEAAWEAVLTKAAQIAMSNNLTKPDVTQEDAERTQQEYANKGIATEIKQLRDDLFIVSATETDESKDVVAGKVLKSSSRHTKPDFSVLTLDFPIEWSEVL